MRDELESLTVHGPTKVGWDECTPPNETVDAEGKLLPAGEGFSVVDPRAPGRRAHDDPQVEELRAALRAHNGIEGLEICTPAEVERAARIFHRDGFVVVRDLLDPDQLASFRSGCARVLAQLLSVPGPDGRRYMTETGRLPHRYSYGTCSGSRQMLHEREWGAVVDLPTTTPLLERIFGGDDYAVWGGGGDLCLPGAIEYQHLHADFRDPQKPSDVRFAQARRLGVDLESRSGSAEPSLFRQRLVMERTPPVVTINFLMSDLTWENGPIRQIPGSHAAQHPPPALADEPPWMRLSTLVGAPAGAGVFRDNRAWHGGTPNLSREIRALPNVEYAAPWYPTELLTTSMPHELWETLSPHARRVCRFIKSEPGEWPAGAGVLHPLASGRQS